MISLLSCLPIFLSLMIRRCLLIRRLPLLNAMLRKRGARNETSAAIYDFADTRLSLRHAADAAATIISPDISPAFALSPFRRCCRAILFIFFFFFIITLPKYFDAFLPLLPIAPMISPADCRFSSLRFRRFLHRLRQRYAFISIISSLRYAAGADDVCRHVCRAFAARSTPPPCSPPFRFDIFLPIFASLARSSIPRFTPILPPLSRSRRHFDTAFADAIIAIFAIAV